MVESLLSEIVHGGDESVEKIMLSLLDEKGLDLKTDIEHPVNMTRLEMFGVWLQLEGFIEEGDFIFKFVDRFKRNRVSHKRQSRKEIVQMVEGRLKDEKSSLEKLTSKPG